MRWSLALTLLLTASCRVAERLPVSPYTDPAQLDVPWPKHSHVKQPWRGFLETRPATELLEGIGICYQHPSGAKMDVQLGLLRKAGIRCIRWEQPFGSYDPNLKSLAKHNEKQYREMLQACKKWGIVPIILLNAHHGYPCKLKSFDRRLTADAPKGSTELLLDDVSMFRPLYSGTNGLTQYWAGEILFTEIDPERKAVKLSKPLPKEFKKGDKLNCVDLYYLPFFPVGTPEFEETALGWVEYAHSICRIAREEGIPIEIELWNELSFGSHFAGDHGINAYWPGKAKFTKDFLNPGGHAWEVSRRTIEMVKKEFPSTRCIWGWSNTTFFHTPIEKLPPGTDGQSYHPYGTGWREFPKAEQAPNDKARCLEGFCPTYKQCFAEGWAHTLIQCESLMHHLRPNNRLARKPEGVERFHHYITEHGIVPAEAGVHGEAASLRLKERFLLRAVLFWLNKGLSRITLFHAGPEKDNEGMALSLAKVKDLQELPPDGQLDDWLSPALRSLRRAVKVFDGAVPIPSPRQLDVDVAKLGQDQKVFEMPEGRPTLWRRDLFAVLPFQATERKFVLALYEMSPTYNVEEMKDVPYRLTIRPVAGERCGVSYYDPLADRALEARVIERRADSLTLELPVIDTPRLLILEEKE